jgi:hypothetical protein
MIAAIYVDHELMDSVKNERESDAEGDEKNIILVLMRTSVPICIGTMIIFVSLYY